MRRDLEQRSRWFTAQPRLIVASVNEGLVRELQELIAALDRRVPRVEQAGEPEIARDAAALRARAVRRLEELLAQPSPAKT